MAKTNPAPLDARDLLETALDLAFDLQESAREEPSASAELLAFANRIFDLQSAISKGDFAAFAALRTLLEGPRPPAFRERSGYLAARDTADETLLEYGKAQQRILAAARKARREEQR